MSKQPYLVKIYLSRDDLKKIHDSKHAYKPRSGVRRVGEPPQHKPLVGQMSFSFMNEK